MDDLISRQSALDALDKHFESFIKRFGYDSYERADEKTKLVCDGLSEAEDVIIGLPSATDTNVGTKLVIDPYKIECAIRGLTEWQQHVQTESDIDRDISVAVEALKAQLGTNLAEVGTDCISRQAAIEALTKDKKALEHIINGMSGYEKEFERLLYQRNQVDYDIYAIEQLPPAEPERIRGQWIKISPANIYECSECGKSVMTNDICAYDFCHGCGADMREVTT